MEIQLSSKSYFDFLPDDFFTDEILSRMGSVKSIVRLGMTSKRFRSLCSYPSVLDFHDVLYDVGLIEYLNDFFESRMKSTNKHKFQVLRMYLSKKMDLPILLDFVTTHLLGWFHKALSLNVQELIFECNGGPLYLDSHHERPELNLHDSMIPLKNLRVLTLYNIPISLNDSFGNWISTCCANLEELNIHDALVLPTRLTISSLSLRIFIIQGDFVELHVVSTPKLENLGVKLDRINFDRDESHPFIKISDAPNLESFWLENLDNSYDSLIYESRGDNTNFPSLKHAGVILQEAPSTLERLFHDIIQTRILYVTGFILHQVFLEERTRYYANKFKMLNELQVDIIENEEYMPWDQSFAIMEFAQSIPSLKVLKLNIVDYYYVHTPLELLEYALSLNVGELQLRLHNHSKSMDNDNYLEVTALNLPYFMIHVKNLRILTLKDIPIALNHNFEDWISNSCNLQELNLCGILVRSTNLNIISSSLRVFTIDAHFMHLHVFAPKLKVLHVTWNLFSHQETHEKNLSIKVSEYSPDLEKLFLSNLHTSLPLEYSHCYDDKSNFPSLISATVLIPEIDENISLDSLKRLLLDVRQARKLFLSDAILHKISCSGIIDSVNSIHTNEKLHVHVEVNKKSRCWENAHKTIISIMKVFLLVVFIIICSLSVPHLFDLVTYQIGGLINKSTRQEFHLVACALMFFLHLYLVFYFFHRFL